MKRVRLSTLLLLIVILALTLALVVQSRRAIEERRDLMLLLRDTRGQVLRLKEEELIRLYQEGGSRNDPRIKAAAAELEKLRSDYNATIERLRALQLSVRRAP